MSYEFLNGTGHRAGVQTRNSCDQAIFALPWLQGAGPTRGLVALAKLTVARRVIGAPNLSLADYTRVCGKFTHLCAAYVGDLIPTGSVRVLLLLSCSMWPAWGRAPGAALALLAASVLAVVRCDAEADTLAACRDLGCAVL